MRGQPCAPPFAWMQTWARPRRNHAARAGCVRCARRGRQREGAARSVVAHVPPLPAHTHSSPKRRCRKVSLVHSNSCQLSVTRPPVSAGVCGGGVQVRWQVQRRTALEAAAGAPARLCANGHLPWNSQPPITPHGSSHRPSSGRVDRAAPCGAVGRGRLGTCQHAVNRKAHTELSLPPPMRLQRGWHAKARGLG